MMMMMALYHATTTLLIMLLLSSSSVAASAAPYHTLTSSDLPLPNLAAAQPSPLKGFVTSPEWHTGGYIDPQYYNTIESTMEFYYIGLSDVMTGMDEFNFESVVEPRLVASASRGKHSILRFYMDYPRPDFNSYVSHTPQFLKEEPYNLQMTDWTSADLNAVGSSPDYTDANLIMALENFVTALGNRYDGDTRIGYIQIGLLGFWGEWHTWTGDPSTDGWIPDSTKMAMIDVFDSAFQTTQLQTRYAHWYAFGSNQRQGFGLHDDSFAYSTIDEGVYPTPMSWFFWSQVESLGANEFWKYGAMGGEVRPELQSIIFDTDYPAGTQYHQDFGMCAATTHATYMLNYYAFGVGYQDEALESAIVASNQMGYAFRLLEVSIAEGAVTDTVDITATVIQDGLAPFYYDLSLALSCPGFDANLAGVDDIISEGSTASFTYTAVPATNDCLSVLEFSLSSSYVLDGAPVKFAQGSDGSIVGVSLPLPPTGTSSPTDSPTSAPTSSPSNSPTSSPTATQATQAKYICSKNEPSPVTICADGSLAAGDCATENDNNGCHKGGKKCWWNPSCPSSNTTPSPTPLLVTPSPTPSDGSVCPVCPGTGQPCCETCYSSGKPSNRCRARV